MAFNAALSGINGASSELNVVGNNIANASTAGFKGSRVEFADVYAASALGTASNAIGNGVRLAGVEQNFSQGTIAFTSNSLDLAINGQGFFVLNDGGSTSFSRAGSFKQDDQGFIINSSNQRLRGFLADSNGNITGAQGDLQIDTSNIPPSATTSAAFGVNVPATATAPANPWVGSPNFGDPAPAQDTYNHVTTSTIYDSLGNGHVLALYFIKTGTVNEWDVRAQVDGVDVNSAPAAAPFTQVFNTNGTFDSGSSEAINLSWAPLDALGNANGATTPQTFNVSLNGNPPSTQFGSPFAIQGINVDGFTTGRLDSVDIGADGIMFGRYTNGQSRSMGQVLLANFTNPNGLQPVGDTAWAETFTSGSPLIGDPGTASLGLVQSGALEESNVDLTAQLVKMIIAQRNFQANAQTIRTEDTVTQTIINIR